jgi:hypothetical protein
MNKLEITPADRAQHLWSRLAVIAETKLSDDENLSQQIDDEACALQDSPLMLRFLQNTLQSINSEESDEGQEVQLAVAISRLRVASERVSNVFPRALGRVIPFPRPTGGTDDAV